MTNRPPTPGFLVWRLSMRWRAEVERAVTPLGLTHAQYSLLASLRGLTVDGARPSQRELADHTGLEPIFVSKLLRRAEANGLVTRTPNPDDSRAVCLALTDEGIDLVDQAAPIVLDLLDELLAPLGGRRSKETERFAKVLQRLLAAPPPTENRSRT